MSVLFSTTAAYVFPRTTLGSSIRLVPSSRSYSLYLGLTAVTLGLAVKSNCVVACFINYFYILNMKEIIGSMNLFI
jgi:hypothetical protein